MASLRKLVVLTTVGLTDYVIGALESLKEEEADILLIDDGSSVDYSYIINNYEIDLIQKKKGKGVTDSWNIAYKLFKDNYDYCLFSNDDVIFPGRVPPDMWNGLEKYIFLGPLSDPIGSGRFMGNFQNITTYLRGVKDFKDVKLIQNRLQKIHPNKKYLEIGKDIVFQRKEPPYINGFCFSFNKDIIEYEFQKDILFNPKYTNSGNDKELQRDRLNKGKAISIKSYIFHYKGGTIDPYSNTRQEIIN